MAQIDERQEQANPPFVEESPTDSDSDLVVPYIEDNLSNLELMEEILRRRGGVRMISAMRPQLGLDLA
jgi:hypothetical protein